MNELFYALTSDPGLTNALNVLKNIPKYFFLTLLVLTSGQTTQAAKEKEKATNDLPRVNTLIPQLLPRNPSAKPPPGAVQKRSRYYLYAISRQTARSLER